MIPLIKMEGLQLFYTPCRKVKKNEERIIFGEITYLPSQDKNKAEYIRVFVVVVVDIDYI